MNQLFLCEETNNEDSIGRKKHSYVNIQDEFFKDILTSTVVNMSCSDLDYDGMAIVKCYSGLDKGVVQLCCRILNERNRNVQLGDRRTVGQVELCLRR